MAKLKLEETSTPSQDLEAIVLETRKVKALEKIANSVDALTVWFEEIDKKEWGERHERKQNVSTEKPESPVLLPRMRRNVDVDHERLTEEARVRGHVGALKHLCESAKRGDDALEHLESGSRAVAEAVRQAIGVAHAHSAAHHPAP